ncbi:MAG: agmatine deiminase family protein [Pseudanabaenaceae cyanobacterium bins.68]|nr:agmatine deiminase family protein [Pseudanabaenaceae cyanobacterium bins.68]
MTYQQPAEWQPHSACWLAYPYEPAWWLEDLAGAQLEFMALLKQIGRSEKLEILVPDQATGDQVLAELANLPGRCHLLPYGDIWLRDIGAVFVQSDQGELAANVFAWNGWGNKYLMPHDHTVSRAIAEVLAIPVREFPLILEGGAIEVDGAGTCLTTRSCLSDRNPHLTEAEINDLLGTAYGVDTIFWLDQGLLNDHTDGHIDTIARFIAPGTVMYMLPSGTTDPNTQVLLEIERQLASFQDRQGKILQLVPIPSPGLVKDVRGEIMPASYLNFYIANNQVLVPLYGSDQDQAALQAIAPHFPTRKTIGLPAKSILGGGGAFHCITQQQPQVKC